MCPKILIFKKKVKISIKFFKTSRESTCLPWKALKMTYDTPNKKYIITCSNVMMKNVPKKNFFLKKKLKISIKFFKIFRKVTCSPWKAFKIAYDTPKKKIIISISKSMMKNVLKITFFCRKKSKKHLIFQNFQRDNLFAKKSS